MADDYADNTSTTGWVRMGGSVTGNIESAADEDWFAVTLVAGVTYQFDLEGTSTSKGTLGDPALRGIHDSDGTLISGTSDDDSGTGKNSRVSFTPAESGTYYVAAGATPSDEFSTLRTGTYTLTVHVPDDFTADTSTTGTVAVGGSAEGRIDHPFDRDWFAVDLVRGKTYQFDLEGSPTGKGTLDNPRLRGVHDSNGTYINATSDGDSGTGNNSRVGFTPTESGTHYVSAGGSGGTGTYTLSVTGDDFTADTSTTGTVTTGGSATGEISTRGDKDWFAVDLEAGKTYQFDLEGSSTDAGSLHDPLLWGVYDSDGDKIAGTFDDDGGTGRNSRLFFTPTESGTYYVEAGYNLFTHYVQGSFDLYSGVEGTYTLSVRDTDDDFLASTRTAGTATVGGSVTGEIETDTDRDWIAVELEAGKVYRFDLKGSSTNAGTLYDPVLWGIHDSNGDKIAGTTDDSSGTGHNARLFFTPTANGTHYVDAGAWAGSGQTGTYTLSVEEVL